MTSCAVLGVCVPAGLAEDVIGRRRATRTDRRTKLVFCFVLVVWFVCCEIHQQQKQNGARWNMLRIHCGASVWWERDLAVLRGERGGQLSTVLASSPSPLTFSSAELTNPHKIGSDVYARFLFVFVCFFKKLSDADFYRRSLSLCQLAASGQQHFGSDASTVHLLLPTPLFLRILSDESGDVTRKQSVLFIATPWDFTPSPSLALSLFLSLFLSFFLCPCSYTN